MDSLLAGFLLSIILLNYVMSWVDIGKSSLSKRTKFNLYFLVFYLPLFGSVIYYIFFKPRFRRYGFLEE